MYEMSLTELTETVAGLEDLLRELKMLMSIMDNGVTQKATLTYEQLCDVQGNLNLFKEILKFKMEEVKVMF